MTQTGTDTAPADASRFGVVDIGSNAIRVQIAECGASDGTVRVIESHRAPVGLGRDVFLSGTIPDATIDATVDVLRRFRESCDRNGVSKIRAIATSAMREASNRAEVLQRILSSSGIRVEVISGSEEAYLLSVAVKTRLDVRSGRSLLVDLGGGSVEVSLVQDDEVVSADSYRLGSLRLLRALTGTDSDEKGESFLDLLDEYVGAVEGRIRASFGKVEIDRYIATGGNIDTIADVLGKEGTMSAVDGVDAVKLKDLNALTRRLAKLSYVERMRDFDLKPDRADTILPAAVVYYRIGRVARVDHVLVPRVGMRDGLLREVVAGHLQRSRAIDHRTTVLSSCRALGRRYRYDAEHAEIVRSLAVSLFDQTAPLHRLGDEERTLLEAAAILHDIGVFVSNNRHHKHTWYLVRESDIVGLTTEERELVALTARYHRRAHPNHKHYGWAGLTAEDQHRVHALAALLRVADSLDRGHRSKVVDVRVNVTEKSVDLTPVIREGARADLVLEALGVAEKSTLFREVFGRRVRIVE